MSAYSPGAGLGTDDLRAAVRAVLRDVLPAELLHAATPGGTVPPEHVAVRSDAELDALVRRVASLCEDPTRRAALKDGRHGFRLAGGGAGIPDRRATSAAARPGTPARAPSGILKVERGAVTERMVIQAAGDGARLLVGAKAVLTPLARDKARVLGVEIEKER